MKAFPPKGRAGRPKSATYDSVGHRRIRDNGSVRLLAHKLSLISPMSVPEALAAIEANGNRVPADYADTIALAEYPLGALAARGDITPQQAIDGAQYGRLYALAIGRPTTSVDRLWRAITAWDFATAAVREPMTATLRTMRDYEAAAAALTDLSMKVRRVVDEVAIYERFPRFLEADRRGRSAAARRADALELQTLTAGLDALTAHFDGARRRKGSR